MYSQNFNQPHDQQLAKPVNEYQPPVPQNQMGAPNAYYAGHTSVPQQPFNPQMAPVPYMQAVPDPTILDSAYLVYLFDCLVPLFLIVAMFKSADSRYSQNVIGYALIPALYIALVAWMWRITVNNPPGASSKVFCFLLMRWVLFAGAVLSFGWTVLLILALSTMFKAWDSSTIIIFSVYVLCGISYLVAYAFSQKKLAKIVNEMKLQESMRNNLGFGANNMSATI